MKRLPWLVAACLVFVTCVNAADEKKPTDNAAHENPLMLDVATQKQLGIETAVVQQQTLQDEIHAPGEVQANAYATTLITPRIVAQVVRRHTKLGDEVKIGQPLVTLTSVELAEAQGALVVAEQEWQRVKQIGADAVSGKRYTEAQVARDQAQAKVRAFGMSDSEVAALLKAGSTRANGEFALLAPQAGRITSDDFIVGERVEPGKALFTLVNETTVWIEAQLGPDAAERIETGNAVRIVAHDKTFSGHVVQLSHRTEEGTRTTPVRIEAANANDQLHPGEFVEAYLATKSASPVLAIPTEAILQLQNTPTVFKAVVNAPFEPLPIVIGESRGVFTTVKQGLAVGDTIVVKGAYALKARLLKSQLGEE